MKKINFNIPNNTEIEVESKTPITDFIKPFMGNLDFRVCGEDSLPETLTFIEEYRDAKLFYNQDGFVVTREMESYIVHYDMIHPTLEGKIKEVKCLIDKNRDRFK